MSLRNTLHLHCSWRRVRRAPCFPTDLTCDPMLSWLFKKRGGVGGYGITLCETAYAFEVDGRRLYTWCALDALMFPVLIGKTARVVSRCPATQRSISLTVSPDEVREVEPASAVVSLPPLEAPPNIRSSFRCHVHFYASALDAHPLVSSRRGMELVCVEDAFRVGRVIAELLTTGTAAAERPDLVRGL
jgi:alkylmercury lyase